MIGFIYKTTCLVNGKIYIGKHEGKRYKLKNDKVCDVNGNI